MRTSTSVNFGAGINIESVDFRAGVNFENSTSACVSKSMRWISSLFFFFFFFITLDPRAEW